MEFTYGEPREIWSGVRRIVANNKGPLTHNGTNTYIVGKKEIALIDPGPNDSAHVSAILEAVKGETVTHILLTHTHKDHSGALRELKEKTGAAVYAHAPILENRGARRQADAPLDD
ncbi:MAG: MBL fold metallo-hydrolase, partial [Rhizobiales bacterium]|nr:MBL fold metallo-hydrolase [Hyphomicrobiales bacterium]